MRIQVTPSIAIDDGELGISFIRASGPGGQNVNKVATAVQLRFDMRASPWLSDAVKTRLLALAGRRLTREGVIVLTACSHRTQDRNRQDAIGRLIALIRAAAIRPATRRATRASFGERQRRLDAKGHRSDLKRSRQSRPDE